MLFASAHVLLALNCKVASEQHSKHFLHYSIIKYPNSAQNVCKILFPLYRKSLETRSTLMVISRTVKEFQTQPISQLLVKTFQVVQYHCLHVLTLFVGSTVFYAAGHTCI